MGPLFRQSPPHFPNFQEGDCRKRCPMTNEFISGTQIISIIIFVFVVFGLYKLLVRTKDATIELLKVRVRQLENTPPDILLKQATEKYEGTIERLKEEQIEPDVKNTALEELVDMVKQTISIQQRTQIIQNIDPMIAKSFSMPSTAKFADVVEKYAEKGEWSPSVQYTTGDSSEKYAQVISVDEAKYTFHQGNVKVFFDFSVDLKKVPIGSALGIGGMPFTIDSRNVYEFKVRQTGLNHSEDLTVSPRCGYTSFDLLYVTDGSEGSVRFWGYIVYDCAQKVLRDLPDT